MLMVIIKHSWCPNVNIISKPIQGLLQVGCQSIRWLLPHCPTDMLDLANTSFPSGQWRFETLMERNGGPDGRKSWSQCCSWPLLMFTNFDVVFLQYSYFTELTSLISYISAISQPNALKFSGLLHNTAPHVITVRNWQNSIRQIFYVTKCSNIIQFLKQVFYKIMKKKLFWK